MTRLSQEERNEYLAAGVHIGMREKNEYMLQYTFKQRPDGMCIIDIEQTDARIEDAASFIARYEPERVLVVSRKEAGNHAAKEFAEATGIRSITGRFLPGALTNPDSPDYFEVDLVLLVDPTSDQQALREAVQKRIPVIAMCDTFNDVSYVDFVLPTNNKGKKAVGLVFHKLAEHVLRERGAPDADIEALDVEEFQAE